jgi:hypothetical protein
VVALYFRVGGSEGLSVSGGKEWVCNLGYWYRGSDDWCGEWCVCGDLRLYYDCLGVVSGGAPRRGIDTALLHLNYL